MRNLFQIESIKTFSSNTFRTIITLHLLLFIMVVIGIAGIDFSAGEFSIDMLYSFPHVWEFFTWIASWFNILLVILMIVLVSNEFRYNTFRQQLINGLSRGNLLAGKIIAMFYIALYAIILVFVSSLVSGFIKGGEFSFSSVFLKADILLIYFIQTLSYMSLGLMIAVILRSNALSIVVFILYLFPGEVILRKWIFPDLENFFPVKVISDLTPLPDIFTRNTEQIQGFFYGMQGSDTAAIQPGVSMAIAVVYLLVFTGVSYWILQKRSI